MKKFDEFENDDSWDISSLSKEEQSNFLNNLIIKEVGIYFEEDRVDFYYKEVETDDENLLEMYEPNNFIKTYVSEIYYNKNKDSIIFESEIELYSEEDDDYNYHIFSFTVDENHPIFYKRKKIILK